MAPQKALHALLGLAPTLLIALVAHAADAPTARHTYVIAGSGSGTPIAQKLAKAYHRKHPDIDIEVPRSIGSTGGIRAVKDGAIDLAVTSRPARPDEMSSELTFIPFAQTPVIFGAHETVEDTGLSRSDVVGVFAGTKTRWRNEHEIVVLMRDRDETKNTVLKTWAPELGPLFETAWRTNRWRTLFHDDEMIEALEDTPHSIGVTDLGVVTLSRDPIKILALDGIAPTLDAVRSGQYPLSVILYFVYRGAQPNAPTERFLAFLFSANARALLESSGYIPLQPEAGRGP